MANDDAAARRQAVRTALVTTLIFLAALVAAAGLTALLRQGDGLPPAAQSVRGN